MSLALAAAIPGDASLEQRDRDQQFVGALDTLLSHTGATHTARDVVTLAEGPGGSFTAMSPTGCCALDSQATPLTSWFGP